MNSSSQIRSIVGLKVHFIPVLLLLTATFAVYTGAVTHEFLLNWDDNKYVTANEAVRGFSLDHLKAAFSNYYVGNYAPLHIVSYMLDYSIWGMRTAGFIFTNIFLHSLNGVLFYVLLIKLAGRKILASLAAFIFLLHPVQVESVAWISQRKNVLAMFFFLVSFLLYVGYREYGSLTGHPDQKTQSSKRRTRSLLYTGALAAFVAALLAKSVAAVLPLVLMLHDLCFLEKAKRGKWLTDKIPFIAASAVIALIALNSQAPEAGGGRTGYHGGNPLTTFFTMLPVFVRYLGMLFWPVDLSAVYKPAIRTGLDGAIGLSAGLIALLFAGGAYLFRRRKDLFFWSVLFVIGLLPVSQIVPIVTLMNDRYLYFPMLGSAAFVAGVIVSVAGALKGNSRRAVAAGVCLLLLPLPILTFERVGAWRNSLTLWTDAVEKVPESEEVWRGLADTYYRTGRHGDAIKGYQRALSLDPLKRDSLHAISALYLEGGEPAKAEPHLVMLVLNYPKYAEGFTTLCHYYYLTGNPQKGQAACQKALALDPGSSSVLGYLGDVYLDLNRLETAREYYRQALEAGGETAEIRFNMAGLEAVAGNHGEAMQHLESAFQLGYRNTHSVLTERKLGPLRVRPEFKGLLDKYFFYDSEGSHQGAWIREQTA